VMLELGLKIGARGVPSGQTYRRRRNHRLGYLGFRGRNGKPSCRWVVSIHKIGSGAQRCDRDNRDKNRKCASSRQLARAFGIKKFVIAKPVVGHGQICSRV
jgi:hypothetical protein